MNEPVRQLEVRVGSATDALTPLSRVSRSFAATRLQWVALAAIALAAVVVDQVTKHVVVGSLRLGEGVHVVGPFTIRHVENSGIAFGFFSNATAAVIVVTAIAIGWMLAYFARSGARHPVLPVALGLVIGGSVSNLADRVRLGFVTDFLDVRYWPAFNVADSCIVIGVGILLAALLLAEREPPGPQGLETSPAKPVTPGRKPSRLRPQGLEASPAKPVTPGRKPSRLRREGDSAPPKR